MSTRDGVIVLGASHWHVPRHVDALVAAGIPVVAAYDADEARAAELARTTGATVCTTAAAALDAHPGAVALVLVEHRSAPDVLSEVVGRRRPFVLEKPGTVSAEALAPILAEVERHRIATAIPFVNRYSTFWDEVERTGVRDAWDYAHFHLLGGPPQRYVDDRVAWMLDPEASGGGALRNLGVHAADAINLLTRGGGAVVRDAALSNRLHGLEVEDYAAARLETAQGQIVTIEAGYAIVHESGSDKELRVLGRDVAIVERPGQVRVTESGVQRTVEAPRVMAHYDRFAGEVAGLFEGRSGLATLADLHAALAVVDEMYAVARRAGEGEAA